jgi:hypothetical protein
MLSSGEKGEFEALPGQPLSSTWSNITITCARMLSVANMRQHVFRDLKYTQITRVTPECVNQHKTTAVASWQSALNKQ